MNEKPLISVIIPVYNTEKFLAKCLDSVISQTYVNLEIIIINDGSKDNSQLIIDEYAKKDKRIVPILTENRGPSSARNYGLEISKGEYITFVDSDDFLKSDMYEIMVNSIDDCEVCVVGYYLCYKNGEVIKGVNGNQILSFQKNDAMYQLAQDKYIESYLWNKLFKRSVFDGVRFPVGKKYEDIYIMHEVFNNSSKICCVGSPEYYYVQRGNSTIHNPSKENIIDLIDAFYARHVFFSKYGYQNCIDVNLGCFTRQYVYGSAFYRKDLKKYYLFLKSLSRTNNILNGCPFFFRVGRKVSRIPFATHFLYKLLIFARKFNPRKLKPF